MNKDSAAKLCRAELDRNNLFDWGVRFNNSPDTKFVGMCSDKDKCIILNSYHVEIHPESEVVDTILHEVAHALTPGHGHDMIWQMKALELGARPEASCNHLSYPAHVVDAIRSGATVEMTVTTHTVSVPSYKVSRLQDKCPDCGKVAKELFSIQSVDNEGNQVKLITLECFHIMKKIIPRATPFESMVSRDWDPAVKACKHIWPTKEQVKNLKIQPTQCLKCGNFKLYDFQVKGARAAEAGVASQKGFGIFDEMGLGKTVQSLAVIKYHVKEYTPTLYVSKNAISFQWFKNIIMWLGPEFMPQIISTSKDFIFPGLKSYVVSYDLLRRLPDEKIKALGIKLVILDECQQVKNPDSARTKEVRKIVGGDCKVLPLSGTPWKNRGSEFFVALNMIDPVKFYSYQAFLDRWVDYFWEGAKRKMGGIRNIPKFKEYTESLLIRREYNEVMDEFPDVNRMKLPIQLDELQQNTYDSSESKFAEWYNQFVIGGEEDKISSIEILAQMSRMRHITGLAKIPATLSFLENFVEDTDKKMVVFVHHQDVGELMYEALKNPSKESNKDWHELAQECVDEKVLILKYTSELSDGERFSMQELFNRTPRAIMIASTLACGEGVDLQTCCDSILHERQWNPQNEDQATPGRFKRIGQKSGVINITNPEAEGTIDEQLDAIVERKRKFFHEAMNKGEAPVWNEGQFVKELAEAIVAKHKARKAKAGNAVTNITAAAKVKR